MSDDGASAIVVIALLGSPFSPDYARARRRRTGSALDFCSMNVALYSRGASAWTLFERAITEGDRTARGVCIGASSMRWEGDRLEVDIDERTTPFGRPLRGKVVLHPQARTGLEVDIDDRREHQWWPVAPLARIEVDLPHPGLRFAGHGYHDANAGAQSLESGFETWNWSRARTAEGAILTYDVECSSGAERSLSLLVTPRGDVGAAEGLETTSLPTTAWGIGRRVRVDDENHPVRIVRTLENGPFYARTLVATRLRGDDVVAMHEAFAVHRLRRAWVRFCTEFRMRRAR